MDEAVVQTAPVSVVSVKRTGWLIPIVVFGLLWFELINQLKPEWWLNPQYNYGLIVPLLALYLFWKRWRVRPTPTPPAATAFPIPFILLCAALALPIRFLAEANPDWRLLSWLFALVVVTISLLFLYIVGGRVWVRHFAFPVLFFLVAVPWPVRIEQVVIQDLMRIVTAINVTFLQLAAVPALQHGNVIEVGTGFIGIEEACRRALASSDVDGLTFSRRTLLLHRVAPPHSDRHRRAARVRLQCWANRDSGLGWDNQRTKIDRGLARSGRPDNFDGLFAWALGCESHHATARQCIAHRALDR